MGYDLHITRAEEWIFSSKHPISAQEWLDIIKEDLELIPSPENGKFFVIWRGTTQYPETWFNWHDGQIFTKNPDKATLWKLFQLAQKLDAQLQGDEGEVWTEEDIEVFPDPEVERDVVSPQIQKSEDGFFTKIKRIFGGE